MKNNKLSELQNLSSTEFDLVFSGWIFKIIADTFSVV